MNMWNVKSYKLISKLVASDSPYYTWCPDGERILTATCAPRLHVHLGTELALYWLCLHKYGVPSHVELWPVSWHAFFEGIFPAKAVTYPAIPSDMPNKEPKVYRQLIDAQL